MMTSAPLARRTATGLVLAALLAGAAGCTSPNPDLFTLVATPGTEIQVPPRRISMRTVNVARYLERPEIVRGSEDVQLNVRANAWWGEPLSPMIGRVLVDNLGRRVPAISIFPENSGITVSTDATLEVNIQRMDADSSGQVQLRAQVVLIPQLPNGQAAGTQGAARAPSYRTVRLQTRPDGPDIRAEVAAMSRALGLLADDIAQLLRN